MKKLKIVLFGFLLIVCIWVGSMLLPMVLTSFFGNEFSNFEEIDYSTMFPNDMEYRVTYYSPNKAIVYFWMDDSYGEQIEFKKDINGNWKTHRYLAGWSSMGGNADDYFIWPYFKDYVW